MGRLIYTPGPDIKFRTGVIGKVTDEPEKTVSGAIASFDDGADNKPLHALSVAIEPVQDLHGYSSPWPAGGGANLWDGEWESGEIGADGNNKVSPSRSRSKGFIPVRPSTTYYHVGIPMALVLYDANKSKLSQIGGFYDDRTFTTDANCHYVRFFINYSTMPDGVGINYPSTVTTYQPYSNICPISGHSTAAVTRTGKNLVNITGITTGTPNTTYVFPKPVTSAITISAKNNNAVVSEAVWRVQVVYKNGTSAYVGDIGYASGAFPKTFAADADNPIISITYRGNTITSGSYDLMVEYGSSASSYEPFNDTSLTIGLDGTRYGGTLDVLTGELTVDRVKVVFDGSNKGKVTYKYPDKYCFNITTDLPQGSLVKTPNNNSIIGLISDTLKNETDNYLYSGSDKNGIATSTNGNFSKMAMAFLQPESVAAANAWLAENPITVIAPLAAPLTVRLDPQQMSTLLGENHIWADTGDTEVTYPVSVRIPVIIRGVNDREEEETDENDQ